MIDPPQKFSLLIDIDTIQDHVAKPALSPPTIRVIDAGFAEHPHEALGSHE